MTLQHNSESDSAIRHVAKVLPKPSWLKVRAPSVDAIRPILDVVKKKFDLNTVCEEAACPNISECWKNKHAAFMILGSVCTRACAFCNVKTGRPDLLDPHEPEKIALAVKEMDLQHVVITSVDRDDLPDGGAEHFANVIQAIRKMNPNATIEILTPDFRNKSNAINIVVEAFPDVYSHDIQTVPRLYRAIRPGGRYFHSLNLLRQVKELNPKIFTKGGLMLGIGERDEEVLQVLDDMVCAGVDFLTLGQYLQPTLDHAPVDRYLTPEQFKYFENAAMLKGFLAVSASPFTRSSHYAEEGFKKLREAKAMRDRDVNRATISCDVEGTKK